MKRAASGLDGFLRRARGATQWGRNVAAAGAMVAASAVAITAALAAPVVVAAKFNASMSEVAAVSQASAEDMAALTKQAKLLGSTTSFSATQAAGGMKFFGQAGFKVNEIMAAMPGTLALARAGSMDLAGAADISSNILQGFGLEAGKMAETADLLTAAFTTSNTNLQMLGETMKYAAPIAKAMGQDMKTTAAMVGVLGNAGIQSSMAGTGLAAVMRRLGSPSGQAAKALSALGVSALDDADNVRNMIDVITELSKSMKNLPSGQRLRLTNDIFGEEASKSALTLLDAAAIGKLGRYAKELNKVEGAATRVANKMNDNLSGDWITLKSAIEGLFITIGTQLDPVIRPLVQSITRATRAAGKWAEKHPRLTKFIMLTVGAIGGLLAVFAPLMLLAGGLAASFGFMATGITAAGDALAFLKLKALGTSGSLTAFGSRAAAGLAPYGAALGRTLTMQGLFEAAAARGGWANMIKFQALKAQLSLQSLTASGKAWIVTSARMAAGALLALPARIGAVTLSLKANTLAMLSNARQALFTAAGWRSMGSGVLARAAKGLRFVGVAIRGIGAALAANPIGIIVTAIGVAAAIIYKYWAPISGFFKGLFGGIWDALKPLHPAFAAVGDAIGFILAPIGWLMDALGSLLAPVDDVGGAAESMGLRIGKALGGVVMFFLTLPLKIISVGVDMVKAVWGGLKAGWAALTGWVSGAVDSVTGLFKDGFLGGMMKIFLLFNPAVWVIKGLNALSEALFGFSLFDAGNGLIDSLMNGILAAADKPIAAIKSIIGAVTDLWPFGGDTPDVTATLKQAQPPAAVRKVQAIKRAAIGAVAATSTALTPAAATPAALVQNIAPIEAVQAVPAPSVRKLAILKRTVPPVATAKPKPRFTAPAPLLRARALAPAPQLTAPIVRKVAILKRTVPPAAKPKPGLTAARPLAVLPPKLKLPPIGLAPKITLPSLPKAPAAPRPAPQLRARALAPAPQITAPSVRKVAALKRTVPPAAKPKPGLTAARPLVVLPPKLKLPPVGLAPKITVPSLPKAPAVPRPAPLPQPRADTTAQSQAPAPNINVAFNPQITIKVTTEKADEEDIKKKVMEVMRAQSGELAAIIAREVERAKRRDFS